MEWTFLAAQHRPPRPIKPIYLNRALEPTSGIDPCRHFPDTCIRLSAAGPMQGRAPAADQGSDQIPRGARRFQVEHDTARIACATTQASPEARL